MNDRIVRTGDVYGVLTVITESSRRGRWTVLCDCGTERSAKASELLSGHLKSCGCQRNKTKHGLVNHPDYMVWNLMKVRCYTISNKAYAYYGGRGIAVCDRWRDSFENFLADMGPRPSLSHTLERIDNDGHYSPENCRWATRAEQMRNQRGNNQITAFGRTMIAKEWAEEVGIAPNTIARRIRRGWTPEDAVTFVSDRGESLRRRAHLAHVTSTR